MGDLTKNISRHELVCKCGDCNVTVLDNEPVIQIVQGACDHFADVCGVDKVLLIITSAARCYIYNRTEEVGSNDNSQHPRACAIDFQIYANGVQVPTTVVDRYLRKKYPGIYGFGLYNSFNHADTRPGDGKTWDYSS